MSMTKRAFAAPSECLQYQRTARRAIAAIAAALALTACSSSKDAAPATGPTTTEDAGAADTGLPPASNPACDPFEPRAGAVDFATGPTDADKKIVDAITAAKTSIDLEVAALSDKATLTALVAAKKRSVTLRVVVATGNAADAKGALGGEAVHEPRADLVVHANVMVVDAQTAFVGSGGFADTATDERTFTAVSADPTDVDQLRKLVEHDFNATAGSPAFDCTKLVLSPVNARERVGKLVDTAKEKLDLELMEATDDKLVAAITARITGGVHTRVLLADPGIYKTNAASGDALAKAGAEVRYFRKLTLKSSLAISERAALVGSHNVQTASMDTNRDVSVLVANDGPLGAASDAFEAEWATGTPH